MPCSSNSQYISLNLCEIDVFWRFSSLNFCTHFKYNKEGILQFCSRNFFCSWFSPRDFLFPWIFCCTWLNLPVQRVLSNLYIVVHSKQNPLNFTGIFPGDTVILRGRRRRETLVIAQPDPELDDDGKGDRMRISRQIRRNIRSHLGRPRGAFTFTLWCVILFFCFFVLGKW